MTDTANNKPKKLTDAEAKAKRHQEMLLKLKSARAKTASGPLTIPDEYNDPTKRRYWVSTQDPQAESIASTLGYTPVKRIDGVDDSTVSASQGTLRSSDSRVVKADGIGGELILMEIDIDAHETIQSIRAKEDEDKMQSQLRNNPVAGTFDKGSTIQ